MKTRIIRGKLVSAPRSVRLGRVFRRQAAKSSEHAATPELTWTHFGVRYRVTLWAEARLERLDADRWTPVSPAEGVLESGMLQIDAAGWRRYMEFMPATERAFVGKFRYGRLAALLMIARCPELMADLDENPALVAFLAAHESLRGTRGQRWEEVGAVHERGGLFGVLEWLGLPAAQSTLVVLGNLIDPDVPRRLLEPLRSLLWQPIASSILQRTPALTDRQLARYCHGLAA